MDHHGSDVLCFCEFQAQAKAQAQFGPNSAPIKAYFQIAYRLTRRHYRKRSPILCRPFQVGFELDPGAPEDPELNTWQQQVGPVVFHCQKQVSRSWLPRGTGYIRKFLKDQYGMRPGGEAVVQIPEELEDHLVCVSVPAKNFRCGTKCTEFVARDNQQGFWSYQMICGGVQMTLLHVDDETFVAGMCIYARNRWSIFEDRIAWAFSPERLVYQPRALTDKLIERRWCRLRHQWIIVTRNQYGEINKFEFNAANNSLDPIECFDCSGVPNAPDASGPSAPELTPIPDCLNWLKVEFCASDQKPVMIGRNASGAISHFIWNPTIAKFQLESCEKCQVAGRNRFEAGPLDQPPSYEYLELIEMVEQ